jgi:hypothetical protein
MIKKEKGGRQTYTGRKAVRVKVKEKERKLDKGERQTDE